MNPDLTKPPLEFRELNLLKELEANPVISQRELSHKLGFALGVTNACLKRMVERGWVRMAELNHRKTGYYLTPEGTSKKARLTLHLISWTVKHYSTLRNLIGRRLVEMERAGVRLVVFYGVTDEMEIAYISLHGVSMRLVGIIEDEDKTLEREKFGFELEGIGKVRVLNPDAALVTSLADKEERIRKLKNVLDLEKTKIYDIPTD